MSKTELSIQGIVVSYRNAADKLAANGDASGLEDCQRRACVLLDELEARREPDEHARLREVVDEAR